MKQTALEWFADRIKHVVSKKQFDELLKQAKEMEKQQIIDAYRKGFISDDIKLAGDYYKETFKSE